MRITPGSYGDMVAAVRAGLNMSELVGKDNLQDAARAAADTGATIPIQLYLFRHYDDAWGYEFNTSKQLQKLVDELPDGLLLEGVMVSSMGSARHATRESVVCMRGPRSARCCQHVLSCLRPPPASCLLSSPHPHLQMHINGYPEKDKPALVDRFFKVACPLAKAMDKAGRRLQLHWADSVEVLRLVPANSLRMAVPASACDSPNVDYWARIGFMAYGSDTTTNKVVSNAKVSERCSARSPP